MCILCTVGLLAAEAWHWCKEFEQPAGKFNPVYFLKMNVCSLEAWNETV